MRRSRAASAETANAAVTVLMNWVAAADLSNERELKTGECRAFATTARKCIRGMRKEPQAWPARHSIQSAARMG